MKAIIIGGSGFIGSHVADSLTERNFKVTIYDKKHPIFKNKKQKYVKGDILNLKKLEKVIHGQDYVFMFAGLSDLNDAVNNPIDSVKLNILSTVGILKICVRSKIKRFVFSSSIYANSKSGGFYRSSKLAAEEYIKEFYEKYKLNYTVLRYGSIYGPRSDKSNGIKKIILDALSENRIKYMGNKRSVRQYIHVKDAAEATSETLKPKYKNRFVIIKGNRSLKVKTVLLYLARRIRIKKRIIFEEKKYSGHYILSPEVYTINKGINFRIKNNKNFFSEVDRLIIETKHELRKKN